MSAHSFPQFETRILINQYINVSNADEIRSQLLKSNPTYNYCFLNGDNILNQEQLYSSLYQSLLAVQNGTMKTNTSNSEVILNLSNVNNINDSFKKFGISSKTTNIIVLKFLEDTDDEKEVATKWNKLISGDSVEFSNENLLANCDLKGIRKVYKLTEENVEDLVRAIIGVTQMRGL